MGVKTFSEMQDDLKFELGQRDDLDDYYDDWINAAYKTLTTSQKLFKMKKKLYFPQLETSGSVNTVDGTAYIAVPATCLIIRDIWNSTEDQILRQIGAREYREKLGRADTDAEGAPTLWNRQGSNIYLYPTPDDVYALTVYFKRRVTTLSSTSDVTLLGEEWDNMIVKLAVLQSLARLKEYGYLEAEQSLWAEEADALSGIYYEEEKARNVVWHVDPTYLGR